MYQIAFFNVAKQVIYGSDAFLLSSGNERSTMGYNNKYGFNEGYIRKDYYF